MGSLCTSSLNGNTVRCKSFSLNDSKEVFLDNYSTLRSFHGEYKLQDIVIGTGLLGEIRLCHKKSDGKQYAVKIIQKSDLTAEDLRSKCIENQFKIMEQLSHPVLLKFKDYFEDYEKYYLVMQYLSGGDLFTMVEQNQQVSEESAAQIMKQLFSALAYLHARGLVHRDIKCENILIEESSGKIGVKLIDFDTMALLLENQMLTGKHGTVYYMAPEVIKGEYNEKCDVWSAGIVLYTLITKNYPFGGNSDHQIMHNITNSSLNFSDLSLNISPELLDLLQSLLTQNIYNRISALSALSHPWILKHFQVHLPLQVCLNSSMFWSYLKFALKMWVIQNIVPSAEVIESHLLFIYLDKNADGAVSAKELLGIINDEKMAEVAIDNADWNSDGVLDYYEFLSLVVSQDVLLKYSDQIIKELDKDSAGGLSISCIISFLEYSLGGVFRSYEKDLTPKEIKCSEVINLLKDDV